jgi:MFS family permease
MFLKSLRSNPRGWLVVAVVFATLSVTFSARMSLPLLIPGWAAEFGWSLTFLSGGASLILIVMGATAPFIGNLIDRFGPRYLIAGGMLISGVAIGITSQMTQPWMFLAIYCVGGAIGYGVVSIPNATAIISRKFHQNRGFATSIGMAGVGGGQLVFLPLIAWAITSYGWRSTLASYGVLLAVTGLLALAFLDNERPAGAKSQTTPSEPMRSKLRRMFRNPVFLLLSGAYFICGFTTTGVLKIHLIPYASQQGFSLTESTAAFAVLAGFDMVGMVLAGWLSDRMNRPMLLGGVYFLRALSFILLFYITGNIEILILFALIFGTLDFATVPLTAGLVASHLGVNTMGLTMGVMFTGHSLGGAIGAFLGGWFFDMFDSYDLVWIMAMALALVAAVLAWSVPEKREAVPAAA